jgi:hypothetical protein
MGVLVMRSWRRGAGGGHGRPARRPCVATPRPERRRRSAPCGGLGGSRRRRRRSAPSCRPSRPRSGRSAIWRSCPTSATSAQCVDRAVEQGSGRPKSCGLYRATEIARIFGRTVRRSSLRDISPLTVLSFVASLADRAGRGGEVRADCGRGHRPGPGSSVPGRRHHHTVLVLCRERRAVEPQAVPPGSTPNGLPARRRRHLHLRPAAGMHPRCERHFATTPVAEIVAHSGGGIVDKGAEASAMAKRLIVCCDGT